MLSSRGLILLILLSGPHVAANLRLSNLDATLPSLPPLTLNAQASGFGFDLYSALSPASSSTLTNLLDLPGVCAPFVGPEQECTTHNMTATNITFEDCGDPFTVCRCSDATMSVDTIVDRLGRVPVGLRCYIGVVFALNGSTRPSAYTLTTGDMHLRGNCEMDVWIHEASQSFDFAPDTAHSSAPGWSEAIANDTCVLDIYSLTNEVEDFAQMSVMRIYMLLYNGHLPPLPRGLHGGNIVLIQIGRDTSPPTLDRARVFTTVATAFASEPTASVAANPGVDPTHTPSRDDSNVASMVNDAAMPNLRRSVLRESSC
ncbi:hypothetical protein C8F04DRAFT_1367631 [Mycena alexandri]|uniref:Uncharacterized protein n=1 Tax=Mycena alexandri TaxID=1745969 RepID=A0AAD6WZG3_9AGAR|nr:hypothetical protein C8F04DRAFT_1367631 [Mycena alexandri]